MDSRKQFLVVLLSVVAFFAAVEAVCDSSQPLGYPYPDDDYYNGTVKVEYDKMNFVTRIELKENYPEEGHKNIRIAVFNCENVPDSPAIGTFKPGSGSQMSLGLEVEKDNDNWYLVVNNPQDYEIPSQRYYSFSVLGDGALYDVVLNIENVDDESPYFLMPDSKSCEIKETVIGPSSCLLTAYDPDAIMDDMKFTVLEGGEISENISLVVVSDPELCRPAVPKDCFTVAIYIKAELEFINRPVHSLVLVVVDQAGHNATLPYVVQVIAENKDIPHFTPQQLTIFLDEKTPGIVITNETITVTDRDALDYGQFTLTVEGDDSYECYKAFDVIPRAAYRYTEVKLLVINPDILDYDAFRCNDIIVKIKAIEITDETRTGEVEVNIKLIALNDESPIFEKPEYEFRQRNIHP